MIRMNGLWIIAVVFALAACDKPKWTQPSGEPATASVAGGTTPTKSTSAPATTDALPALPSWASSFMGRTFLKALPNVADCLGNLDVVSERYTGSAPGTKVIGWGWALKTQKPIDHVVLVDQNALVVGAGEGGQPRPDVPAHSSAVKSANTGWAAYTSLTKGPVDAYGVVDGAARCALGHLEL